MKLEEIMDSSLIEVHLSEEQKLFRKTARRFCKNEIAPHTRGWGEKGDFCEDFLKKLAKGGFLGICVPEEYGGSGGTITDLVIFTEELARTGMGYPITHGSSPATVISRFGTPQQKEKYLPSLASGEKIFCYAQTEPNAGSDVGAMESTAVLNGDYYLVNGRKCFITNAPVADVFILLAKTDPSLRGTRGISVFVVDRDSEGLSIGKVEKKMGRNAFPMGEVILENCKVPRENLIIGHGEGFKRMMGEFNGERCGNSAMCVGYAWGALERAMEYATQRKVGGQEIYRYQGIQWMFADMVCQVMAARFLLYNAAYKFDLGVRAAADSAIAKAFANEMAQKVTSDAMQILGGYGYMQEYELERYYRDARGLAYGGGTTQILRNRISSEVFR